MNSLVSVSAATDSFRLTTAAMLVEDMGINDHTSKESHLARVIDRVSAAVDNYTERTLAKQSYSETFRDPPGDGVERLSLRQAPITAIASITEDGTALSASDYEYDATNGIVYRLSSDVRSVWTAAKIVVAYTAGYVLPSQTLVGAGASGSRTLPYDIEQAAIIACRATYLARERDPMQTSYNIPGVITEDFARDANYGLPPDSILLLQPYRRILV